LTPPPCIFDSGPLISLALAGELDVILHTSIYITDVVKMEVIDKGLAKNAIDAATLHSFYTRYIDDITVINTLVGDEFSRSLALGDTSRRRKNMGEESILEFVSGRRSKAPSPMIVVYEDRWFTTNKDKIPEHCSLLSTSAFLRILEAQGKIPSAHAIEQKIPYGRNI